MQCNAADTMRRNTMQCDQACQYQTSIAWADFSAEDVLNNMAQGRYRTE